MVVHNHRKVWTEEEKKVNYEHGLMYCAVHGFEKFKRTGKNYLFSLFLTGSLFFFNLTIFYFSKINILLFIYFYFFFRTRKLVDNRDAV